MHGSGPGCRRWQCRFVRSVHLLHARIQVFCGAVSELSQDILSRLNVHDSLEHDLGCEARCDGVGGGDCFHFSLHLTLHISSAPRLVLSAESRGRNLPSHHLELPRWRGAELCLVSTLLVYTPPAQGQAQKLSSHLNKHFLHL